MWFWSQHKKMITITKIKQNSINYYSSHFFPSSYIIFQRYKQSAETSLKFATVLMTAPYSCL